MPVARIAKAWQNLKLSKKRHASSQSWLQWGTDVPEEQYAPSALALSLNCPMVQAMFDEYKSLDTPVIQPLMTLAPKLALCYKVFGFPIVSTLMQNEQGYKL